MGVFLEHFLLIKQSSYPSVACCLNDSCFLHLSTFDCQVTPSPLYSLAAQACYTYYRFPGKR